MKQTALTLIGSELANNPPSCDRCGGEMSWSGKLDGWCCVACYERQQAHEASRLAKARKRMLEQSGIGERFIGMTFSNYIPENLAAEKILGACKDYVDKFSPGSDSYLIFIGSPGTGKNMLAAIIGQEIIKKDFHVVHTTAIKCVRQIKDSWRGKENSEQDVIDSFVRPDLLIIDEVGVQFGTPTEQLFLTEIINDRYERKKPMILISNCTLKQLEDLMGARAIDRFHESNSQIFVFNWNSYRRKSK